MKKNLVLGLGLTGQSVIQYLVDQKESVKACDSRTYIENLEQFKKKFPNISIHQGSFNENYIKEADIIYVSPGISLHQEPLKTYLDKYNSKISSDIELFCQQVNKPIIAITGSNGKSTTTTMVGDILKKHNLKVGLGGNLGFPVLNFLNQNQTDYDVFVLELSSFQLETLFSLKNHIAICLNISDDHLDRYQNIHHYRKTKFQIFNNAKYKILFNQEIKNYKEIDCIFGDKSDKYDFITNENNFLKVKICNKNYLHEINKESLKISINHNILNMEASIAASICFLKSKFDIEKTIKALKDFKNLPHRSQIIAIKNGITYVNDSKATNVGAAIASINSFKSPKNTLWVILGGLAKNANFKSMKEVLINAKAKAILIGQDAQNIAKEIGSENIGFFADDFEDIFKKIQPKHGDTVLLAPACASLDMFKSFEDRGNKFIKKVNEIV